MKDRARIFLVSPEEPDPTSFPARLSEALTAAEIAAVLFSEKVAANQGAAELVRMVQAAGAAALVAEDSRVAGRLNADGIQITTGPEDLRIAAESLRPKRIVGAGDIRSRDAAMEAGELGVDYLFFGKPHGDTHDQPHDRALDLAEWWSELMQIPCVLMSGRSLEGIRAARASGAEFIALHHYVWAHPEGPGQAIREAAALLGHEVRV